MQVDSHVRFIRNWDSDLISQWRSARNEMAVLSVYLSDLIGSIDPVTFENTHPNRPIMCKTDYEGNGKMRHLRHGQQPEGKPGIHGEPTLHPFWAAGFSFGRGHFPVQVPYDQYSPMVFQGEEIFQGLRGFTYGYDYYTRKLLSRAVSNRRIPLPFFTLTYHVVLHQPKPPLHSTCMLSRRTKPSGNRSNCFGRIRTCTRGARWKV